MRRDKNSKSLEIFKKGFRKNEVVIYAIALMLVTAGYFNYTANVENRTAETYSEEVTSENAKSEENNNSTEKMNSTEIVSEKSNESEMTETIAKNTDSNESKNNESKKNKANNEQEENKQDDEDIGDAKLVDSKSVVDNDGKSAADKKSVADSNNVEDDSSDYFVSTKLQRDTNYADTLSTYTKILEDGSVSETQKSIAMKEITKINDTKNAISICENLLYTKGFEHYVVLVNNESINVVVKVEGELTKQKVAQIQNIISREFKCEIENIHISERS